MIPRQKRGETAPNAPDPGRIGRIGDFLKQGQLAGGGTDF
jgi:hypothetical protein